MTLPPQFWNIYMQLYDLWVGKLQPYRQLHDELIREANVRPTGSVLDLGCGTGNLIKSMIASGHRGRIIGLDASPDARRIANAKFRDRTQVNVDEADLDTFMPRGYLNFDAIFCVNVLYALDDPTRLLMQLRGILMDGGVVAISNLSNPNLSNILEAHDAWVAQATAEERAEDAELLWARRVMIEMNKIIADAAGANHFHIWTQEQLDAALEAAGFQVFYRNPNAYAGTAVVSIARKVS